MKNQKAKFNRRAAKITALALLALPLAACSTSDQVDFSAYPRIPSTPTSKVYRTAAKSNPFTGKAAFYGNYGGPGCNGGKPIDHMDELFRRHDLAYLYTKTLPTMIQADQELVHQLQQIDPQSLTPESLKFQKRAINFFSSNTSHVVGKPVSAFFQSKERPNSPFAEKNALHRFFAQQTPTP